jgi:hypothetical protein
MNQYANISNFGGKNNPPCAGTNDPLTYCLVDTMDKSFQHGSIGHLFGPRSQKCQAYMSERCANNWDGFCEYSYKTNTPQSGAWPNAQIWPDTQQPKAWNTALAGTALSTGEQLLANTAMRKYCTFNNCPPPRCEPFDPTNPDSPNISYYDNSYNCIPTCTVDPSIIDNDPVMDRMISNPKAASTTLINICNTARRTGAALGGTKIGNFCNRYFQSMDQLN